MKRKQTGKPEVFAIRKGTSGWELSRRSLFSAAAAAAAAPHRASAGVCAQRVNCIAISPNGRWLASGSDDQTIKLWSLPDGALLKTLVHAWNVYSVAIGPDSRLLASACATDKTIKLWSVPDGALLKTLTGHTNYVRSVDFSPDGKLLASGSWDGTVRLWSLPDGALLKTQTGVGLSQVACSPDGRILVVLGASGDIRLPGIDRLDPGLAAAGLGKRRRDHPALVAAGWDTAEDHYRAFGLGVVDCHQPGRADAGFEQQRRNHQAVVAAGWQAASRLPDGPGCNWSRRDRGQVHQGRRRLHGSLRDAAAGRRGLYL